VVGNAWLGVGGVVGWGREEEGEGRGGGRGRTRRTGGEKATMWNTIDSRFGSGGWVKSTG